MKNSFWILMIIVLTFGSCGDDIPEKATYKNGVIVVNQGAFQTGTGTLTYKDRSSATVVQDIFSKNNEGAFLGNIAQSMIEHQGKNYISINNGGKIVVTDKDDFNLLDTIGGINQSRYFAQNGDDLFASSWGVTGFSGSIFEINTALHQIKNEAKFTSGGPEGMIFVNDQLYVAKSGGFGVDSVLLIYDMKLSSFVKSIVVGDNPELIVKDNDDNIYLICNGYTDYFEPSNSTTGRLVKIKGETIIWSYEITNGSNRLAIDADKGFLYFNMNGNVVKHDLSSELLSTTLVREGTATALGFDYQDDKLYIGDSKDFISQGEVYVYSTDDIELESFKCGIIPSYFHFQ
jgi:hypothetical protein